MKVDQIPSKQIKDFHDRRAFQDKERRRKAAAYDTLRLEFNAIHGNTTTDREQKRMWMYDILEAEFSAYRVREK